MKDLKLDWLAYAKTTSAPETFFSPSYMCEEIKLK